MSKTNTIILVHLYCSLEIHLPPTLTVYIKISVQGSHKINSGIQ